MKYIVRILSAPFLFIVLLVANVYMSLNSIFCWIKNGGEFHIYEQNEKATIQKIYDEIKNKD